YGLAILCYVWKRANGFSENPTEEVEETKRLTRIAAELGRDDAITLARVAVGLAFVIGDVEGGAEFAEKACALNPNYCIAWHNSSWIQTWLGRPELGIQHASRGIQLSPLDPEVPIMQTAMAFGYYFSGRPDEARFWAEKAMRQRPTVPAASV